MKYAHVIVLTILVLITAIVIAILIAREQTLSSTAQATLDEYVQYQQSPPSAPVVVVRVARASLPSHFTADMSSTSYGSSNFYDTTHDYREPVAVDLSNSAIITPSVQYVDATRPIPFPPVDVWCVLLKPENSALPQVVFVGLHQDLYNADWLVHEPPANLGPRALSENLAAIDCNLNLGSSE